MLLTERSLMTMTIRKIEVHTSRGGQLVHYVRPITEVVLLVPQRRDKDCVVRICVVTGVRRGVF